jgi:hypothetical protein
LSGELVLSFQFDRKVNVSRASWVGDWFDSPEIVFTAASGHEAPKSLEVGVPLVGVAAVAMQIDAMAVYLPDLDERVPERVAA